MTTNIDELYQLNTIHVKAKIGGAVIDNYPFPHLYVNDIFTHNFFNYVKSIMPGDEQCPFVTTVTNYTNSDFPTNRRLLPLKDAYTDGGIHQKYESDPIKLVAVQQLCKWFRTCFLMLIVDKFNIQLPNKYRDELLYIIDTRGYYLAPHSDLPTKIFSALIYMPDEDNDIVRQYGTNILKPVEEGYTDDGNTFYKNRPFNIVKTLPFVPNSLLVIIKANNSFHSTSEIKHNITRRLLIYDTQTSQSVKIGTVHGKSD